MGKLTEMIEKVLMPLADKLEKNHYLKAITNGFSVLLPVTMIGAIFTLLSSLNIEVYQNIIASVGLKELFSFAPKVTTDLISLYAVYLIGKACAVQLGYKNDADVAGIISLFVFLLMIPIGVSGQSEGGETVAIAGAIGTTYLGSAGLFSAMILGLIVPTIYCWFLSKNITIKMPEQVPPMISKSFGGMIPGFVIAFLFSLVRLGFGFTQFGDFNTFIYTMLRTPLSHLGASPLTFILFIAMCSLMWFFGLHGGMIVLPFLKMLYTAPGLENLAAMGAGAALPNAITQANWFLYASLGGAGGTLGLCILMFFTAKSARYKTLGKLALPAGICGINEPVTFGLPMVLNTIMVIPLIITPIVTFLISYVCMMTGIVPYPNGVAISVGTPVILSGLIGAGWQSAVLQVVLIIVQMIIFYPFFAVLDKKACEEEGIVD